MDFIDAQLPELKAGSESDKLERSEQRNKMRTRFAQPGGQGSKFKNTLDKMMKNLALPKGAKDELGITGDNGMEAEVEEAAVKHQEGDQSDDEDTKRDKERKAFDKKMMRVLYSEGRYHIVPSFFRTLMYLKKQK